MVDDQDRLLPIANIGRIMKQILPPRAKISKEAKETIQECATEFISFVTGEASDKCHKENRKTVNGDDICWALSALGFDDLAGAVARYLYKFREFDKERLGNQNKLVHTTSTDNEEKREAPSFEDIQATRPSSLGVCFMDKGQTSNVIPRP